jgi:rhodanese-related sulfurtransferase
MRNKIFFLVATIVLATLVLSGCASSSTSEYMDISAKDAKVLIDDNPDIVIIDVSPKYDEGHIPGAINYYVGDGSLDEAIPTLDKSKTYLVYCHVDSASISGASKLIEAGFENVYRLEGNYAAWVDAGYPVEYPVSSYVDLSPMEAKELIDSTSDLVIIDVSPKYDEGHIPGAINYYVGDGSLDEAIPTLDKTKTYLVYCHVDSASISGASKLIEAGFKDVYRLEGNYAAWVDAGYPVEK